MSVEFGIAAIRSIDWSRYRIITGGADRFGDALEGLLYASSPDQSRVAWTGIENVVFAQNTIFSAAEPTVDVVLATLVGDPPRHVRTTIIDLLFLILGGASDEDPDLHRRCRERAMRGIWLLVREAAHAEEPTRDAVLEAMELIDPTQAATLRMWLGS